MSERKTKWTEGPWRSECGITASSPAYVFAESLRVAGDKVNSLIARAYDGTPYENPAIRDANARLIAASPELVEMLRDLVESLTEQSSTAERAKALLARVDGGEA